MKELIPFAEDTELVVGKYYNVRCAFITIENGRTFVAPILGIEHEDKQFNFPHRHWHIDGRFTNGIGATYDTLENGRTNGVVSAYYAKSVVLGVVRRKCKRLTTGLTGARHLSLSYIAWYKSMIGKSCKGRKCPHFGTHMLDDGKDIVCPLHGLRGSKETEIIISDGF